MLRKKALWMVFFLACHSVYSQNAIERYPLADPVFNSLFEKNIPSNQFTATSDFLDAAINSINSFNSLIKKENYRNKIASFNNPTSSDMGFNLENEIQTALKPLLAKAKNTDAGKFSQIVSSLVSMPVKTGAAVSKTAAPAASPVFSTLLGLVGNLTVQEKKITRDDLDSFINATSRYFVQYEKLNQANLSFDRDIDRLNNKLTELQYDLNEYMLDMITVLQKLERSNLKKMNNEELFLKYLDKQKMEAVLDEAQARDAHYPSDGIKSAKDIANNLQKLFNEYQKVYSVNYQQIRSILTDTKKLGKNIVTRQTDASLKDLEELYNDSKNADVLSLRLTTLFERLKTLVATEQVTGK